MGHFRLFSAILISYCIHVRYVNSNPSQIVPGSERILCSDGATPPASRTDTGSKIQKLRVEMRRRTVILGPELDAYIIPSYDEHQSEIPSDRDRRLRYISGFSGSDGVAVITLNSAALWTDGRYKHQADMELACSWLLMKQEEPSSFTVPQWIGTQLSRGARIGADPRLIPHHIWERWSQVLDIMGMTLVQVPNNLVDVVWNDDNRPSASKVQMGIQRLEFAGKKWQTKVEELRKELYEHKVDAMVVTALDEIAWLLNVRGKDLMYSPVTKSYLIVSHNDIHLYIEPHKLSYATKTVLNTDSCYNTNCTNVHNYDTIWSDLKTISQPWRAVLLPSVYAMAPGVSEAIFVSVSPEKRVYKPSPIIFMKAKKNPTEISGMRNAHIRDGAAMCEVLAFIEKRINQDEDWDEWKVVREVDLTRKSQQHNKGLSFPTIAGYGPNSALPHYQPTNLTSRKIMKDSTFVLDSGGQYDDGTTDVTRTLHYGSPTAEEKKAYTLVLMASIDLASMVIPSGLKMNDIDVVARNVLWQHRKGYMHSTGHGIGAFLQAHEAPIQIAFGQTSKTAFKPGYFFSNEPGYYEEGNFGVRLENILEVKEAFNGKNDSQGNKYLKFEDVTLVPYEPKLIDYNMLTLYQRRWLNNYNTRIRDLVGAELKKQMKMNGFYWMMNNTVLIPEYGYINSAHSIPKNIIMIVMCSFILFRMRLMTYI